MALADAAPRPADSSSTAQTAAAGGCVAHWDTTIGNPGMNDVIGALAVLPDGDLVAGGAFTMAGGNPANRIARWDGSQWHPLGGGFDDGAVIALAVLPNGDLIAAGNFTTAGGAVVNRVARWDGLDWHPLGTGIDGTVFAALALPNGDLVVGGNFHEAGGEDVDRVARWDGSQWHAMGDGTADVSIQALAWFNDGTGETVFAGGWNPNQQLVRWEGSSWSPVGGGLLFDGVTAMAVGPDGKGEPALFVAGFVHATLASEFPLSYSATLGVEGWEPLDRQGISRGAAVFDDGSGPALYFGRSSSTHGIVKWDGSWWLPIADGLNGFIRASIVYDDGSGPSLYVAGGFTSADGEPSNYIVRLQHCPPTSPVTHHVPGDYATIQAAIDAANDGDIIRVSPGTYNEMIDFLGKSIIVESEDGPETTIIDATALEAPAVAVPGGSQPGTTLRGFTVTGSLQGVAIWGSSTLTIDHCFVVNNGEFNESSSRGIFVQDGGKLLLDNSVVKDNSGFLGAGAMLLGNSQGRFRESLFRDNIAHQGGGARSAGSFASFIRCTFQGNSVLDVDTWPNSVGGGVSVGGVGAHAWYPHFFNDCDFINNTAEFAGGGLAVVIGASASVNNCRFIQNDANRGGAINSTQILSISGSEFKENVAEPSGGGGGVRCLHSPGQSTWIKDSLFCKNEPDDILGNFEDLGGNAFFNVCDPMTGDLNGDGVVDVSDLLILLAAWGYCADPLNCPADLNGDEVVDVSDMLILLANWG